MLNKSDSVIAESLASQTPAAVPSRHVPREPFPAQPQHDVHTALVSNRAPLISPASSSLPHQPSALDCHTLVCQETFPNIRKHFRKHSETWLVSEKFAECFRIAYFEI